LLYQRPINCYKTVLLRSVHHDQRVRFWNNYFTASIDKKVCIKWLIAQKVHRSTWLTTVKNKLQTTVKPQKIRHTYRLIIRDIKTDGYFTLSPLTLQIKCCLLNFPSASIIKLLQCCWKLAKILSQCQTAWIRMKRPW